MLIVLEGLDGAGKSTQIKLVREYIESCDKKIQYLHFPRYNGDPVYGDLIARFLRGEFGTIDSVHPQLVALLFAEDRHSASAQIKEWLESGDCVLLDRYVYSNIAYQCSKLKDKTEADKLQQWILKTEYEIFGIPKPDINIFLDVPINFVDEKLKENRLGNEREYLKGKADIHEADISFQSSVRECYLRLTAQDENFVRIDCGNDKGDMSAPDVIFSKIKSLL